MGFFIEFFSLFLPPFIDLFCFCLVLAICSLLCLSLHENVPLVSPIFLKRYLAFPILLFSSISLHCSLRRLSYLSFLFSGTLQSVGYIFPFHLCLSHLFFSQLFVRSPQTSISPFCISFSSVQSLSHVWLFVTSWTAAHPVHCQLLEFTQTHVHRVGDAIQPPHSLSAPSPAFSLS